MAIPFKALKPNHLRRYGEVARLLFRHGGRDLLRYTGLEDALRDAAEDDEAVRDAESLADDLEELGPTFIKLGQILSTRGDMLPASYLDALTRLQDRVKPFDVEEAERVFSEEIGTTFHHAFAEFNREPIAAASLGQVHMASLRSGQTVAVKIQRPDVHERIRDDLDAFAELASLIDEHTKIGRKYEFSSIVADLRRSLSRELDYREEAGNLRLIGENLARFERLLVPQPIEGYVSRRVLTMDFVEGRNVSTLTPLARQDVDGRALVDELFEAYLNQLLVDGIFHADPHPGNVFLTTDHRLALLDMGMVGRVTPHMCNQLLKLMLAIASGRGEDAANVAIQISDLKDDFDRGGFERGISELVLRTHGHELSRMHIGEVLISVQRVAADHGVRIPHELRIIAKTILNLERVADSLCDDFNPTAAMQKHAVRILNKRMLRSVSPTELLKRTAELKEFLEGLPARVNRLLELLTDSELRLRIDAIDEDRLMSGFQKIANRITVGLVIAAMILGGAMLMDADVGFTIFGYNGIAVLMLTFAVITGMVMVVNILWNDIRPPHDPHF